MASSGYGGQSNHPQSAQRALVALFRVFPGTNDLDHHRVERGLEKPAPGQAQWVARLQMLLVLRLVDYIARDLPNNE